MASFTNTTMLEDVTDVDGFIGSGVDAGFTIATMGDLVGVYTEAFLCNLIKYDAVTNWLSLNAIYKLMLSEFVARSIAVEAIKYDMSGYTSRVEAENMINIHLNKLAQIRALLLTKGVQDFMGVNS